MRTFFVLFLVACGSNGPSGTTGGMAGAGQVGAACTADTDCKQTGATCITAANWPGGYCTVKACPGTACPDGTFCQMGGTMLGATTCLYQCTTDDNCRTGYKCCSMTNPAGGKICTPPGVLCQ
jgi:hypothetical protein